MYGLELIITIGATLGIVMSSNGTEGSMSIIVWLLIWRFVLGIGIGTGNERSSPLFLIGVPRLLIFLSPNPVSSPTLLTLE